MRPVLARNWHTPFWTMWKRALPEVELHLTPTVHAPTGWRHDQRPLPDGVTILEKPEERPYTMIAQNGMDLRVFTMDSDYNHWIGSILFLAHNRAEYDFPTGPFVYRYRGQQATIPIVAISQMKADSYRAAGFDQEITVIPPYVNVEDYGGWTGEGGYILTVANNLRRPLFDLDAWLEATRDLPVKLVGEGNAGIRGAVGPAQSWDDLKSLYRCAAAYLSVNKWPNEDGWNLSLLEALATRTPAVALSNPTLPDIPHGEPWVLRASLEFLLKEPGARMPNIGEQFPLSTFRDKWLSVLERVTA